MNPKDIFGKLFYEVFAQIMRNVAFLLVVSILIVPSLGFAEDWDFWGLTDQVNGINWHFAVKDNEAYIQDAKREYSPLPAHITVPSHVSYNSGKFYKVVSLDSRAFSNESTIEKVSLPSTLKSIGSYCFHNCENLTAVEFGSGLIEICTGAFMRCSSLTNVSLPSTVTTVGVGCFSDCTSLRIVSMPDSIAHIGANAFSGCDALTELKYPASLIVDSQTFVGNRFWEEAVFPEGVTSFSVNGCSNLRTIVLPSTIVSADKNACQGCSSIEKSVFYCSPFVLLDIEDSFLPDMLRRSDSVFYTVEYSNTWERVLRNSGYGGKRVCFKGEWPNISKVMVNGKPVGYVEKPNEVTNYVYTTVTNVVKYVPAPGTSPNPAYNVVAGTSGNVKIDGASGWDAFGVPDGMVWNSTGGVLDGQPIVPGTYDLLLVSGSGAETRIMRTAIAVADYPVIRGCVGVSFLASGAPLNRMEKMAGFPSGLRWDRKNMVLSGVPIKVGSYKYKTKEDVPFTIEIRALPAEVVGRFFANVYSPPSYVTNGVARTCDILGTISMTASKSGKLSVSVRTAKNNYRFSIPSWKMIEKDGMFTLEGVRALRSGVSLQVNAYVSEEGEFSILLAKLTGGVFGDGCVTVLEKDVYARSGKDWLDPDAHALMVECAGTYIFGLTTVDNPVSPEGIEDVAAWSLSPVAKAGTSFVKVVVRDTGAATVTGVLPNKTRFNFTGRAVAVRHNGMTQLSIVSAGFSGKTITVPLKIIINSDGSILEGRDDCGIVYYEKR